MSPFWSTAIAIALMVTLMVVVIIWETRDARRTLDDEELGRAIFSDEDDTPL